MKKINLIVCGAAGRMGHEILKLAESEKGIDQIVPTDYKGRGNAKKIEDLHPAKGSVAIDFSLPKGLRTHLAWCVKNKTPIVIGTTGISSADMAQMKRASKKIPVLWSPNMSIGINLFLMAIEKIGAGAKSYDWQIEEFHHKRKKDSPSGTAKWLQETAEKTKGEKLPPVMAGRGGGVFGVHKLHIMGEEEVLTIEHTALSRALFARGAVTAAKWLSSKRAGFYSLRDILNG
jgi:4-hydroxy-tetrahydrodipicolinate reductase